MAEPIQIHWTGDLDDDCTAVVGELTARAECLGPGILLFDSEDLEGEWSRFECWHTAVYHGQEEVFSDGDAKGIITSGEMARAICEAIIRAFYRNGVAHD